MYYIIHFAIRLNVCMMLFTRQKIPYVISQTPFATKTPAINR
jgi:hypothetical protein